ncbi:urease accessory protein UreE [Pararhodospirillum photometricum]|uniref:Urease accessory protein UreE n=1 Tax=Pararhodospirillum photometricum DSM 122 TaxID=1150469 RepID=H6SJM9_PARPM|nr:urease accessory protein UreE [Pararhodospirillum photometricum]CCG08194.1 Urease accessory protein E [Pararhodospirillum photometricum DSM 122]
MRRAHHVHPAGGWPLAEATATLTLPYAERHRRRLRLDDDAGHDFLLDLPHAAQLQDGDGLALDGGGYIRVIAAAEDVAEVYCPTPEMLARIAWHIGNRHMAVQVLEGGRLRLPWDHVLVEMLAGLGAPVNRVQAPFQPESGAYAGPTPSHAHAHD